MLDSRFVRENPEKIAEALKKRNMAVDLAPFMEIEERRLSTMRRLDELRETRNRVSEEISRLKKQKQDAQGLIDEMKGVSDGIKELEESQRALDKEARDFLLTLPNIPNESVPEGKDETGNVETRRWGEPKKFDFEPLNHWDLGEMHGMMDFERAAKIAGARFALMRGMGARLERALMNYMLDMNTQKGYTEVFPPILVNAESMTGTGQLPKFEAELFKIADPEFYLIPTAEVPVTNIHRGEILEEEKLPVCYTAYTPCFRREAGSYGKDTRGLIRQHQFNKVELVRFTKPEDSYADLEKLTGDAEDILRGLELPYRVMTLCTGDIGFSSAKTYDLEVWLPGQDKYREISSCSNFEDFQARRADIRFRRTGKKGTEYVHTLNGSGLAIGRTLVAVLENYQQKDGSILIPPVLRPYMGIEKIG
ncbi:MAG: serine--tRNA ligase [Nitrospiraceae bacterium]|nr:serine--tRNA ligase [Nitrospiraceae bacterium]